MIEACLFDFDGTLTELTLDFSDLRGEVEKITMKYVPESFIRSLDNLYTLEMIYAMENRLGEAGSHFQGGGLCQAMRARGRRGDGKAGLSLYEGRAPMPCGKEDYRIGVMTRNCRAAVIRPSRIAAYVDAVATREDVSVVKPDPGHVMALLDSTRPHRPSEGPRHRRPPHRHPRGHGVRSSPPRAYSQEEPKGLLSRKPGPPSSSTTSERCRL